MIAGGRHHVKDGFAHAVLGQHTIEYLRRAAAPILHLQPGLLFERVFDGVRGECFHRGVDDYFAAFFPGGFNELGCLSKGGGPNEN